MFMIGARRKARARTMMSDDRKYRSFEKDIHMFDGMPLSDVSAELKPVANILKDEGYLSVSIVDGRIVYQKTLKAVKTMELMME